MPLIEKFMELKKYPEEQKYTINESLQFLIKRSRGEVKTGARYIRDFVLNHPAYENDSIINN